MGHDSRGQCGWVVSMKSVGSCSPRKLQIVFNLLAKCDEDLQDLARGVADDVEEGGEDEIGEQSPAVEQPSQMPPCFSQSSQGSKSAQGSTTPSPGGKKAALIAAMQVNGSGYEHLDASKGMKGLKGMKTLAPEGRKAPVVA